MPTAFGICLYCFIFIVIENRSICTTLAGLFDLLVIIKQLMHHMWPS